MQEDQHQRPHRPLAQSLEEVRFLHQMCREGRLYDVEQWITEGKPLQVAPEAIPKGTRPKSVLQLALESGQHSLAFLLLRSGYRLELEREAPLDIALQIRRWDLVDLLVDWGADLKSADVYTVLNTYNGQLYERFRAARYDLTERHEMGAILGQGTRNRPLLGFVKRHRHEDPKIQQELNLALRYHVKRGNEKGVNLCLWAGADPHAPTPNPEFSPSQDADGEPEDEGFVGWSAIQEAASQGHLTILKRLRPDPAQDDFDELYCYAKDESIITFLATILPPKDLTSILSWHVRWVGDPFPWSVSNGTRNVEALLKCGVRWEETNREKITEIRRYLLRADDYDLKRILCRLKKPEVCAPETYQEFVRTQRMEERMLTMGLVKAVLSERERWRQEVERLMRRYDRPTLYEQVWRQPVQSVAKSYGISGVRLGKICRTLKVPVPPRGYWARVQNGYRMRRPNLPQLKSRHESFPCPK